MGDLDIGRLMELISSAYDEFEHDRTRTDRSMSLMIEELDELNRQLESLVAQRTEVLRLRESELHQQNLRFDAALSNMSQALLLFDQAGNLLICNRRYRELYGLPPDAAQPGTSSIDLLQRTRCGRGLRWRCAAATGIRAGSCSPASGRSATSWSFPTAASSMR